MARLRQTIWVLVSTLLAVASAGLDLGYGNDEDLHSFVTRPEIRAPKFVVTKYPSKKAQITPGYWFTAPYANVQQQKQAALYYQACQTGPAIYDNDGELVWSGACQFRNQNAHDFRAWSFNGSIYLSTIMYRYGGVDDKNGHGIIMDSSYNIIRSIPVPAALTVFNMHEFQLSNEGRTAMFILWLARLSDISSMNYKGIRAGWVGDLGFMEQDLVEDKPVFEWWAADSGEVKFSESKIPVRNVEGPWPTSWDWIHANSIDKNNEGDYIFSGRHTDTVYKISGKTGTVLWRLGGDNSSFEQDFHFSRQHNARVLSTNATHELITIFDNSADNDNVFAKHSTAKLISLDRQSHKATLLSSIPRPDGNVTRLRGNYQTLDNGHHFICWSENSYFSEHAPGGELLLEAKFASHRFVTYRGYKANFTGIPNDPPDVVAVAHGVSVKKASTAVYVSWNGATEVVRWRVLNGQTKRVVGERRRTGFETLLYADGFVGSVAVEAVDGEGNVIGTSRVVDVTIPDAWEPDEQSRVKGPGSASVEVQEDDDWMDEAEEHQLAERIMDMDDQLWYLPVVFGAMLFAVIARWCLKASQKSIRRRR